MTFNLLKTLLLMPRFSSSSRQIAMVVLSSEEEDLAIPMASVEISSPVPVCECDLANERKVSMIPSLLPKSQSSPAI